MTLVRLKERWSFSPLRVAFLCAESALLGAAVMLLMTSRDAPSIGLLLTSIGLACSIAAIILSARIRPSRQ